MIWKGCWPSTAVLCGLLFGETDLVRAGGISESAVGEYWEHRFGPGSATVRSPDAVARLTAALASLGE